MKKKHVVISAAAIITRFIFFWEAPLWYDENFTYLITQLPFSKMIDVIVADVHPPLFYIITKLSLKLFPFAWATRIPSVFFSIWAFFLYVKILRNHSIHPLVQDAAIFLMALLPFQISFAQEARMYAMFEVFMLFAVLMISEKKWRKLSLALALLLYTHNIALFYMPFIFFIGLIKYPTWKDFRNSSLAFLIAFITWLPWLTVILTQAQNIHNNYWIKLPSMMSFLYMLHGIFWGGSLPFELNIIVFFVLTIFVLSTGIFYLIRYRPQNWEATLLFAFGPAILLILASYLWQPILLYRQLIGSAPFLYLTLVSPLEKINDYKNEPKANLLLNTGKIVSVLLITISLWGYYTNATPAKRDDSGKPYMNAILPSIMEQWTENDVFYHILDASLVNTLPYTMDATHYILPECEIKDTFDLSERIHTILGVDTPLLSEISHNRIWLIAPMTLNQKTCHSKELDPVFSKKPFALIDNTPSAVYGIWIIEPQ